MVVNMIEQSNSYNSEGVSQILLQDKPAFSSRTIRTNC